MSWSQPETDVPDSRDVSDVRETVLLRPDETVNGNAGLTLIELSSGARLDVPAGREEVCYYLLAGRGTVAFPRSDSESRWIIDPDTAVWIAAGTSHALVNVGEGPFRCLAARCGSAHTDARGKLLAPRTQWPVLEYVGFISRTIFTKAELDANGASRLSGVDLETLTPNETLGTHAHAEEVLYMLRGRGFVRTADGDVPVEPGSVVYTGPSVPHSVHNTEDDNFQYIVWEFRP